MLKVLALVCVAVAAKQPSLQARSGRGQPVQRLDEPVPHNVQPMQRSSFNIQPAPRNVQPEPSYRSAQELDYNQYTQTNEVSNIANDFGNLISQAVGTGDQLFQRMQPQLRLFDESSVVQSYLDGTDNTYTGVNEIALFFKQFSSMLDLESQKFNIVAVDEAKGVAILDVRIKGTVVETNKDFDADMLLVMEVDVLTKKIKTMLIVSKDKAQIHDAIQTRAEKLLEDMIMSFYQSDSRDLMDMNSPVWSKISDRIQVKAHMYPSITGKTVWNGKAELIQYMQEMQNPKYLFMEKIPELIEEMDFKVLLATDDEVWVKLTWPSYGYGAIKHYTFDKRGQLIKEEMTMLGDLKAWQIYKGPFSDDDEDEQQQRGQERMTDNKRFDKGFSGVLNYVEKLSNLPSFDNTMDSVTMWMQQQPQQYMEIEYCDPTSLQICKNGRQCITTQMQCLSPTKCMCM